MKAVVIHAAKDLRIEEREARKPGQGQVEIAIKAGGICGSDLHYYHEGGFGVIRVKQPMILGHEVAGMVTSVGAGVTDLVPGDRVAISPSLPCNQCEYCLKGLQNHCLDMRFYGSAMRMPHVDGAFAEAVVAEATQCHKIADGVSFGEAAFAEPFAVTLHAVQLLDGVLDADHGDVGRVRGGRQAGGEEAGATGGESEGEGGSCQAAGHGRLLERMSDAWPRG